MSVGRAVFWILIFPILVLATAPLWLHVVTHLIVVGVGAVLLIGGAVALVTWLRYTIKQRYRYLQPHDRQFMTPTPVKRTGSHRRSRR